MMSGRSVSLTLTLSQRGEGTRRAALESVELQAGAGAPYVILAPQAGPYARGGGGGGGRYSLRERISRLITPALTCTRTSITRTLVVRLPVSMMTSSPFSKR